MFYIIYIASGSFLSCANSSKSLLSSCHSLSLGVDHFSALWSSSVLTHILRDNPKFILWNHTYQPPIICITGAFRLTQPTKSHMAFMCLLQREVTKSFKGSPIVICQNHLQRLNKVRVPRTPCPHRLMWCLVICSFNKFPNEHFCWVFQQIVALRSIFCVVWTLFDQALFFLPSLRPSLPPQWPTYILPALMSTTPGLKAGRENKTHGCSILKAFSESLYSLHLYIWLCSSQLFCMVIFWHEEVCILPHLGASGMKPSQSICHGLLTSALARGNLSKVQNSKKCISH